eukprot:TRINITY_DN5935_c0_g1_i2.p1 TRINITY_DN5935_c0_g1~~TRINITY_DN5935_c0_g1_i2.p1  ORF type:complete len:260 (+),score=87.60 TRINITY_DN5935_c0_g1_i2:76-780(+)
MSKQGKKAWRKNIDDSKALDAITTQKWKIESEFGSDLFVVDSGKRKKKQPQNLTRDERKKQNKEKQLARDGAKREKNLTVVPPQNKKRKLSEEKLSSFARQEVHTLAEKIVKNPAVVQKAKHAGYKGVSTKRKETTYDIWGEEPVEKDQFPEGALLPKSKLGKNKKPAKPEPSLVPAVEIDLPGNSYNPTYEDHQDALGVAVAKVLKSEEEVKNETDIDIDCSCLLYTSPSPRD